MKLQRFSLVELIVVVVTVFMFAALGMATLKQLAEVNKNVACQDNLKRIGQATIQYAADSSGFLPFPGVEWTTLLKKPLDAWISTSEASKNIEVFKCPADEIPMDKRQECANKLWAQGTDGKWSYVAVSYGINLVVSGAPNRQFWTAHKLKELANPKECMLYADASARDIPNDVKRLADRHDGKANLVYGDGHVGAIAKAEAPVFMSHLKQAFWVGGQD